MTRLAIWLHRRWNGHHTRTYRFPLSGVVRVECECGTGWVL